MRAASEIVFIDEGDTLVRSAGTKRAPLDAGDGTVWAFEHERAEP